MNAAGTEWDRRANDRRAGARTGLPLRDNLRHGPTAYTVVIDCRTRRGAASCRQDERGGFAHEEVRALDRPGGGRWGSSPQRAAATRADGADPQRRQRTWSPRKGGTLRIGVASEPASAAMDPAKEYYQLSFEQMKCCLLRTLYATNGQARGPGRVGAPARPRGRPPEGLRGRLDLDVPDQAGRDVRARRSRTWRSPADDFIRALEREADPEASPVATAFYYSPIEGFDDFGAGKAERRSRASKAIDDYTLEVTVTEPTGDLGWRMAMPATAPIPPNGDAPLGPPRATPRTTDGSWSRRGPTCSKAARTWTSRSRPTDQEPVAGYIPGRSIVMVRNPSWDADTDDLRPAYADSIEITIGGEVADLYNKVETGDLDYVMDPPEADALKEYSTNPSCRTGCTCPASGHVVYTSMNLGVPPFDDVYVRKAMNFV